jgi:signal transduction histidine kinase
VRLTGRWRRCGRSAAYLLVLLPGAVVTLLALPVWWHRALRRAWAGWQRGLAGWLLGIEVPAHRAPWRREACWLAVSVLAGGPLGLVVLLLAGNLLLAAVVMPLWWAFPAADPVRLLIEVPVTRWSTALVLGTVQLVVLAGAGYLVLPALAGGYARLALAVLGPSAADRLAAQVADLSRTRAEVLEAHGAELRRIERDLHDGTQARLVAIAVRLAVARQSLPDAPPAVARLLREAHEGTEEAMAELRQVVRTIYPPVLADRGLPGALAAVSAGSGVHTALDVGELGQVPAAVQAVAYFAVAEALTNAVRHGRATGAWVRVQRRGARLSVVVGDDGCGGADERNGSGLAGIRRRAEALDGTATVDSPAGGPTEITVELPCGS